MQSQEVLRRRKEVYAFVSQQFAEVQETLKPLIDDSMACWPADTLLTGAKISKGEYLEGLPYMVLDFPRALKGSSKMLFRTLFWWGKGWSCIGYTEGEYAHKAWGAWLKTGLPESFRVSTSSQWQYNVPSFPLAGHDMPPNTSDVPQRFWVGTWIPSEPVADLSNLAHTTYVQWIRLLA